jgi:lysophospholipase L1-like esterase
MTVPGRADDSPAVDIGTRMTVEFQRIAGFHELAGGARLSEEAEADLLAVDTTIFRALRAEMRAVVREAVAQLVESADVRAAVADLPRDLTVACVGDSQTAGHQSWAEIVTGVLAELRPDVRLLNLSKSGDTSMDLVRRLSLALGDEEPALYIVFIGANDACRTVPYAGKMFVSDDETQANLEKIAEVIRLRGGRIVWVTPTPPIEDVVTAFPVFRDMGIRYSRSDVAAKAQLVRERPEPTIDLWGSFSDERLADLLARDGLHLGPAGHLEVARVLLLEGLR